VRKTRLTYGQHMLNENTVYRLLRAIYTHCYTRMKNIFKLLGSGIWHIRVILLQ
jgi:hypothetical protein